MKGFAQYLQEQQVPKFVTSREFKKEFLDTFVKFLVREGWSQQEARKEAETLDHPSTINQLWKNRATKFENYHYVMGIKREGMKVTPMNRKQRVEIAKLVNKALNDASAAVTKE